MTGRGQGHFRRPLNVADVVKCSGYEVDPGSFRALNVTIFSVVFVHKLLYNNAEKKQRESKGEKTD